VGMGQRDPRLEVVQPESAANRPAALDLASSRRESPHMNVAQPDPGASGLPDWLARALADEHRRLRKLARLASLRAVTATVSAFAAVLALVVIISPAIPPELVKSLWLAGAAAIFFGGFLVSPKKHSPAGLAASLDRSRGLPDSMVSALASGGHAWCATVRDDARQRLLASRTPSGSSGPSMAFAALAAVAMAAGAFGLPARTPVERPNPVAETIRSLADEWRATTGSDPAAEVLRQAAGAIKPDAPNVRDVFLSAASAESILRDGRDRLARAGDRTSALSEGLRGILPGLSQALANGDTEAAAALPEAVAFPENSRNSLESLAAELERAGLGGLAEAVRKLAAAKSLAERREALESLSEAMKDAARARAGSDRLSMALARLANAKEPAAGRPEPAIDLSRNKDDDGPPGTGAGSSPNRAPPAQNPDLFAPQVSAVLPGRRNPGGDSYHEVLASAEGSRGPSRVGPRAVSAADYERAMRAVADERIPLSRRSTIRLYFEKLRASQ